MTEVPDKEAQADQKPEAIPEVEAAPEVVSNRVPVIAVSLAALVALSATASSVPSFGRFARPVFEELFSASADGSALPDFSRFSPPAPHHVAAAPPPPDPAPVVPDPVVRAGLRDIQTSEQQNADALESLKQNAATQRADMKRITRQLVLLTAQVSSLQNRVTEPLTTSSIPSPMTYNIRHPNPRTRIIRVSRRVHPPAPHRVVTQDSPRCPSLSAPYR